MVKGSLNAHSAFRQSESFPVQYIRKASGYMEVSYVAKNSRGDISIDVLIFANNVVVMASISITKASNAY